MPSGLLPPQGPLSLHDDATSPSATLPCSPRFTASSDCLASASESRRMYRRFTGSFSSLSADAHADPYPPRYAQASTPFRASISGGRRANGGGSALLGGATLAVL